MHDTTFSPIHVPGLLDRADALAAIEKQLEYAETRLFYTDPNSSLYHHEQGFISGIKNALVLLDAF